MSPSVSSELSLLKARLNDELPEPERAETELRLGLLRARAGETDQALLHLTAARRTFEKLGEQLRQGLVDVEIAATCALKGEHERAGAIFERAHRLARELGDADLEARVEIGRAEAAERRNELDQAREHWEHARRHFERFQDPAELSRIHAALALLHARDGEVDQVLESERLSSLALEEAEASRDPLYTGRSLIVRARVFAQAGDSRTAKRYFRRAINLLQENEYHRDLAEAFLQYGLFIGEASSSVSDGVADGFTDPPAFWIAKAQGLLRDLGGLADLERVREAFRKYGRRATDKIAEVEVLQLLQELKQNRLEVQRQTQRVADQALALLERVVASAPQELSGELDETRQELMRTERLLACHVDQMALSEEKFLSALNIVILERDNIRTLLDLCRSLNRVQDYARLPIDTAKMAAQLTGADRALVAMYAEDGSLHVRGAVRMAEDEEGWRAPVETALSKGTGAALLAASRQKAEGTADEPGHRTQISRAEEQAARHEQFRLGVAMVCPLRHGDKVLGVLYCDKELCGGVFTERDLDLMAIFGNQVATIMENGRVAEEVRIAARLRATTLESINDGVLTVSTTGAVTSINGAAARMLNAPAGEPNRLTLASFPELSFLTGLMAKGDEVEGRMVRLASGDHLINVRCLHGDGGTVVGLVVTMTELKRATSLAQKIVGSTARFTFGDIIGSASPLRRRLQLAEAAARSDSSVLITGESGTGKELLAQAIHNASSRSNGPFVGINCAAIPRELLESELFGYEAGAFTGAKKGGHPGRFELAEGGTILLDEIGDMPLEMQAKLLRVLQEKRLQRLGGTKELPLDTRVIATTNRDLGEEVERGRFRQDLFFRLRVIHIELPPLRERAEDIPMLVEHFIGLFSARLGKDIHGVAAPVMRMLQSYAWPGNIRELEHVLEGEINLAAIGQQVLSEIPVALEQEVRRSTRRIAMGDSSPELRAIRPAGTFRDSDDENGLRISDNERQLLIAALAAHRGNIPEVARALGVSRGTVYNKMRKFNIDPLGYRAGT